MEKRETRRETMKKRKQKKRDRRREKRKKKIERRCEKATVKKAGKAREKDAGWRIDYFVVSERWKEKIEDAIIYKTVMGSDHCPIGLQMK